MARYAIMANKLRTFLSVLGITIGIFCIVVVYALVHSMERNLNDSFSSMGTDVLFVQKWPWDEIGGNYAWWKYLARPQTTPDEAEFLEENLPAGIAQAVAYSFMLQGNAENGAIRIESMNALAISQGYPEVQKLDIESGRYFTSTESSAGRSVAIIGANVAESLFENTNALGKSFRFKNKVFTVIGICRKEGQNVIGMSADDNIYIPLKNAMNMANIRQGEKNCQILLKSSGNVSLDELSFEVEQLMRRYRRLRPALDANFAVNRMSMITNTISSLFSQVKIIGLIIGGFSMLVGCFGVANIMFVSVKERTQEIGIQKALGAKSSFIRSQFLIESVLLCIIGGLIGIALVWLILKLFGYILVHFMQSSVVLYLSPSDIWLGLGVSVAVGIVAGYIPASFAAKLNPVDAIRSK